MAVAALLALTRTTTARAADPDPWLAEDKALHATVSGVVASGSYAAGAAIFDARGHALLGAAGLTLAIGAGKEALDATGLGDPSWKDFAWDCIGTAVGLALAWSVDLLLRGLSSRHPAIVAPRAGALVVRF